LEEIVAITFASFRLRKALMTETDHWMNALECSLDIYRSRRIRCPPRAKVFSKLMPSPQSQTHSAIIGSHSILQLISP